MYQISGMNGMSLIFLENRHNVTHMNITFSTTIPAFWTNPIVWLSYVANMIKKQILITK